ncbi:hypothetical protein ACFL16_00085 [Patescibacteria group bacterium]
MSTLKSIEKKILEKYFGMESGYVLDFSNRTMEDHFKEEFSIGIYAPKYDTEYYTDSKANRLRGIWREESDEVTAKIILSLVEYEEASRLLNGVAENINNTLKPKVKAIASRLSSNSKKETNSIPIKSQNDYIAEIVTFFKKEYGNLRLPNLTYEYVLGHNAEFLIDRYGELSAGVENEIKRVSEKKKALIKLRDIGLIKNFSIIQTIIEEDNDYLFDVVKCTIDESKLIDTMSSQQNIIHKHTHTFENNMQEDPIDLNFSPENTFAPEKDAPRSKYKNLKWEDVTLYTKSSNDELISIFYKTHNGKCKKFNLSEDLSINPSRDTIKILSAFTLPTRNISFQSIYKKPPSEAEKTTFRQQISQIRSKLKIYFDIGNDPIISVGNGEYNPQFLQGGILSDEFDERNTTSFNDDIGMDF